MLALCCYGNMSEKNQLKRGEIQSGSWFQGFSLILLLLGLCWGSTSRWGIWREATLLTLLTLLGTRRKVEGEGEGNRDEGWQTETDRQVRDKERQSHRDKERDRVKETEKQSHRDTETQKDRDTERERKTDIKSERQGDRGRQRQKRETEKKREEEQGGGGGIKKGKNEKVGSMEWSWVGSPITDLTLPTKAFTTSQQLQQVKT